MAAGTHRSMHRGVRWVAAAVGLFAAAALLQVAFGSPGANAQDDAITRGGDIWATQCALCHGEIGRGIEGSGPDLRDVGAAAIDFVVRTGRMPLEDRADRVVRREPSLDEAQRSALIAFYDAAIRTGGPDIPAIQPGAADLSRGRDLFVQNCAACHGATAAGIAVGQRDIAPALSRATPIEIAEAVRIGPGRMPVFGDDIYTDDDVEAVTAWVLDLRDRAKPGGAALGRSGPVSEGAVAWILGLGLLLVVIYLLGERASDAPRTGPETDSESER